jgi:tetratricopeptide (TPR) repeat protein
MTHAINTVLWRGDLAPLREAATGLAPGSDAYAGNAPALWMMHWWAREFGAAIELAASKGNAAWVDSANIVLPRNLYLAWAQRAAGNSAAKAAATAALDGARAALVKQPEDAFLHLAVGFGEAELGRKDDALREGRQALALLPASRDAVTGPAMLVRLAALEVRVGENDAAFDHLRQALALSSGMAISSAMLKLDPVWDPIRNDPRFAQLLTLGEGPVQIATKP